MSLPFISVVTCTYLRPQQLANAIDQFEAQDYPSDRCEMIVLDDAGQYPVSLHGENWRIVSVPRRFSTLGEKRNALASLTSSKTDALCPLDDDDWFAPWTLSAHAWAMDQSDISIPSSVWAEHRTGKLLLERNKGQFHPSWCYSRDLFRRCKGYPWINVGEDRVLLKRLVDGGGKITDPSGQFMPYFMHRWERSGSYHLSGLGKDGWQKIESSSVNRLQSLPAPNAPDFIGQIREWLGAEASDSETLLRIWRDNRQEFLERCHK